MGGTNGSDKEVEAKAFGKLVGMKIKYNDMIKKGASPPSGIQLDKSSMQAAETWYRMSGDEKAYKEHYKDQYDEGIQVIKAVDAGNHVLRRTMELAQ